MTVDSTVPRWRTIGAFALGIIMIVSGVLLTLRHQFDRLDADTRITAQASAPSMYIASLGSDAVSVIVTEFAEESGHTTFVFEPSDLSDDAGTLLVTVRAIAEFSWRTTNDIALLDLTEGSFAGWSSEVKPGHSGEGAFAAFRVPVGGGAAFATIDLTTHDGFITEGGGVVLAHVPSVQVVYNDSIEDPAVAAAIQDAAAEGDVTHVSDLLTNAFSVGTLDGEPLYPPLLTVRASAPQLDLLHPTWRSVTVYPTPTTSNPLNWEADLKFVPYLEYEDLAFQDQTEREQLWGGLGIGLGCGILLLPLTAVLERPKSGKGRR